MADNTTPATATVLVPGSAFTQDDYTPGVDDLWFTYTPPSDGVLGFWAHLPVALGSTQIAIGVYTGTLADTGYLGLDGEFIYNVPLQVPVYTGQQIWFKVQAAVAGTITLSPLLHATLAVARGDVLVNDDTGGFPGAIVRRSSGAVRAFLVPASPAVYANGEAGDGLDDGTFVLNDESAGGSNTFRIYSEAAPGVVVESVTFAWHGGDPYVHASPDTGVFWLLDGGTGANKTRVVRMLADGTLDAPLTHPDNLTSQTAFATNRDDTIGYLSGGGSGPTRRWDLVGNTALADLAAAPVGYAVRDIKVLADDTILVQLTKGGVTPEFKVQRYQDDGTLLQTYTIADYNGGFGHIARGLDDDTFMVWNHRETVDGGVSEFLILDVATGTILDTSAAVAEYELGYYAEGEVETDTPVARFGVSKSCPFILLRSGDEPDPSDPSDPDPVASITVTKVVASGDQDSTEFAFTAGGGLSPSSFSLQAGESFTFDDVEPGSGYSIVETPPEGWNVPSVVVSNASPSVNITVAEGEAVTVTVTNTPDVCECCVSTQLQITNHALAKLGQTRFITDLDEATAEGYTAAQLWDLALHASLRHFPWAFATKYAGGDPSDVEDGYMNLIDGNPSDYAVANEWIYAYRYPVDCMFARRIVPPDGTGRGYSNTPIPFRVGRTWNGTNDVPLIYTNQEDAVLEYTALVECSEDFFDALFEDFLSWRLAGLMAPGLTRTAKTATECYQMAMLLLDQARAVASQEQQQEPNGQATWMQDR